MITHQAIPEANKNYIKGIKPIDIKFSITLTGNVKVSNLIHYILHNILKKKMINKIHLVLVILAFVVVDALATQDMDLDYDAIRAIEPNG